MWLFSCIVLGALIVPSSLQNVLSERISSFDKIVVNSADSEGGSGNGKIITEEATEFSLIYSDYNRNEKKSLGKKFKSPAFIAEESSEIGSNMKTNNKTVLDSKTDDSNETATGLREKRQGGSALGAGPGGGKARSFLDYDVGPGAPPGAAPLCFEREVSGTCRYRTSPDECFRFEWTAYATFINVGFKKITSLPEGLHVFPGGHARVRVFLKSSCCNPIVQFIATDLLLQSSACIVDVRELQDLHPGEIVGIVLGVLAFFIILAIIIALCVRRQRRQKIQRDTVIFGRSLTRSKSTAEETSRNHQTS